MWRKLLICSLNLTLAATPPYGSWKICSASSVIEVICIWVFCYIEIASHIVKTVHFMVAVLQWRKNTHKKYATNNSKSFFLFCWLMLHCQMSFFAGLFRRFGLLRSFKLRRFIILRLIESPYLFQLVVDVCKVGFGGQGFDLLQFNFWYIFCHFWSVTWFFLFETFFLRSIPIKIKSIAIIFTVMIVVIRLHEILCN